jgi:hypothetical protein
MEELTTSGIHTISDVGACSVAVSIVAYQVTVERTNLS